MKGVINERPALPKYDVTWDVNSVLHHLKSLSPVSTIPMKLLSHKLAMLLIWLSGQCGQTMHLLYVRNMTLSHGYAEFTIGDKIKKRPGYHVAELAFHAYAPDRCLYVGTALTAYLARILFLTLKAPHRGISQDALKLWLRDGLCNAGIDQSSALIQPGMPQHLLRLKTKFPY